MNELKYIIDRVKASTKPVQEVLDQYFKDVTWSLVKDEYNKMTKAQKKAFVAMLETERK